MPRTPLTPNTCQCPLQPPAPQVWSLVGDKTRAGFGPAVNSISTPRTARVAIINKNSDRGCNVELRMKGVEPGTHAELHWLKNKGGVASSYYVTWRGQTFAGTSNGLPRGDVNIVNISPWGAAGDALVYRMRVPAGQAVLLVTDSARRFPH